ncbi:MAG: gliding motility-associated ABC transporter substrate-binding protein GldG [Ginsengibacter sp.]
MRSAFNRSGKLWWLPVIILLSLINLFAAQFHKRMDLTNEKRFTVSSPVKKILRNLDSVVQIDIFLKGELPSGFKKLAATTEELLQEFRETGGTKIQYRFISPEDVIEGTDRTYGDTLLSMDAQPINLKVQLKSGEQSQFIYPFALVYYKGKIQSVDLYPGTKIIITPAELNSAEALLEYNFANAIEKLIQQVKPIIAYSIGNGEPTGVNTYDLVENVLKKNYNLFTININTQAVIPDTFKLLMIVKPTIAFTEAEKIKIDQYVMRGGKVMWCIDRLEAEMDSLRLKNKVVAYDRNLNLEDLLFKYGVRINPDLLMDLQCDFLPFDVNGSGQFEFLHWNYFPLFQSSSNHPINKNTGLVAGRFVNSIDTVKANNIAKTILLNSSLNSKLISAPALISGEENRNAPQDEKFKSKDIAAAVLLEGKFTSLYANRVSVAAMDSMEKYGTIFQTSCINTNKMIIISDGDIALNAVSQNNPLPMGVNPFTVESQYQYQFANKDFIENCLSYLINNSGLAEAKAKDYALRLLDTKKINEQKTTWQLVNILLPVLFIILCAAVYRFWRKRKYSK